MNLVPANLRALGVGALIFGTTLLAYLPVLQGGFLWDDNFHVTQPEMQSVEGLKRIWCEVGATQQYYPLLHTAFWVEHRLWGDAVVGYHLTNILLHAAAACLVVAVVRRLALPGACLAGLIFALHPVCVESVAWISEQKNTLATVLCLGAALVYLRFDQDRRPGPDSGTASRAKASTGVAVTLSRSGKGTDGHGSRCRAGQQTPGRPAARLRNKARN